jgi:hypothetical protein
MGRSSRCAWESSEMWQQVLYMCSSWGRRGCLLAMHLMRCWCSVALCCAVHDVWSALVIWCAADYLSNSVGSLQSLSQGECTQMCMFLTVLHAVTMLCDVWNPVAAALFVLALWHLKFRRRWESFKVICNTSVCLQLGVLVSFQPEALPAVAGSSVCNFTAEDYQWTITLLFTPCSCFVHLAVPYCSLLLAVFCTSCICMPFFQR